VDLQIEEKRAGLEKASPKRALAREVINDDDEGCGVRQAYRRGDAAASIHWLMHYLARPK